MGIMNWKPSSSGEDSTFLDRPAAKEVWNAIFTKILDELRIKK